VPSIIDMIVFWTLVVIAIAMLLRWLAGTDVRRRPPGAREILEQRWARGELTAQELAQLVPGDAGDAGRGGERKL
jgi:uncharacterized membrane protein